MSRQLSEVEALMQQLVTEHRKLLGFVEAHQAAMRRMDLRAMDEAAKQQEASRLRIAGAESRRRVLAAQLAQAARIAGPPTLGKLAEAFPTAAPRLRDLGAELKGVMRQVANRVSVSGKLSGAILGHLNTVVRLISGAVEQAGLYTKNGTPQMSGRIGVIEAVG